MRTKFWLLVFKKKLLKDISELLHETNYGSLNSVL